MLVNELKQFRFISGMRHDRFQVHAAQVAFLIEVVVRIIHVGQAAGHSRGEIDAHLAEHRHTAPGHVFTAVVADAFHHHFGAAVADGETFPGLPVKEDAAGSGPIADDVSDDDVVRRYVGNMVRGAHDDFAAGQALPDKIIRLPDKFKGNTGSQKSPEALPRASGWNGLRRFIII